MYLPIPTSMSGVDRSRIHLAGPLDIFPPVRRAGALLALACGVLLLAGSALASDQGPPATVQLLGPPRAAPAGEVFAGELRITPRLDGPLAGFRIEGSGWREVSWRLPAEAEGAVAAAPLVVGFEALAVDPAQPLIVAFEIGGLTVRKRLDLSPGHLRRVTVAPVAPEAPEPPRPTVEPVGLLRPKPVVRTAAERAAELEPDDAPQKGTVGWDIRVHGGFECHRDEDNRDIGADGIVVVVKDEDFGIDDTLAEVVTGSDGSFDVTFHWNEQIGDPEPDLYVLFRAENSEVELEDATWGYVYEWRTGTLENFDEATWNVGWRHPSDEAEQPGVYTFSDVVRTWRWSAENGYDPREIDIQWPDDSHDVSFYDHTYHTMHIRTDRGWTEGTHSHEWGHHFMHEFAESPSPDYCNGQCDTGECGHCLWCWEQGAIPFTEGVPNYFGHIIPIGYASRYGFPALDFRDLEGIGYCAPGDLDDPWTTEGFVGALLVDIHDGAQDDDPAYPGWRDALAIGADEILTVVSVDEPLSIAAFLDAFRSRYPAMDRNLWETARNCGYDLDDTAPGTVSALTSPTHPIGTTSPNAYATFTWTPATDDMSGILGYAYSISAAAENPGATRDMDDLTSVEVGPLSPGTYWFNIRAQDRDLNWSATWRSHGPFTIREAEPANLVYETRAGWDYPVVPRNTTGATGAACQVTSTLPGWQTGTYWNAAGRNAGEEPTSANVRLDCLVDGGYRTYVTLAPVAALTSFYTTNRGPYSVHGGRHTFSGRLDRLGAIMEQSETDNFSGHQFIWSPEVLNAGVPVAKTDPPPDATGGWDHVVDGQPKYYNADGFTFSTVGWWNAAVVRPHDTGDDYDLRLHTASTSSATGFGSNLGWSGRPAGCVDAVLVNKNTTANAWYDVGILDLPEDGSGDYTVEHVISYNFAFGDSVRYTWDDDTYLFLRQVNVPTSGTSVTVKVWTDPPTPDIQFAWYNATFTRGTLLGYERVGQTGVDGTGSRQFLVYDTGYSCVALFRDPLDSTGPLYVTLEVQPTPADLVPHLAAGWYAPLVPRAADDGTMLSVPEPDTLLGNAAATYMNQGIHNDGIANAAGLEAYLLIDGGSVGGLTYASFPAGATSLYNWHSARTVRGGRHSLALYPDWLQEIEEIREDNNVFGEQWAWSPLVIAATDTMHREAPPDPTAGWNWITTGDARYYNCDGLRLADGAENWRALSVLPAMSCDVDIRLHAPLVGAKNGFKSNLGISAWGTGLGDYVLVNDHLAAPGPYDAGVLRVSGDLPYAVDAAVSSSLGAPNGVYGPYAQNPGIFLRLYEVELAADVYSFRLDPEDDEVYWGMALHPADRPYLTKSMVVGDCLTWQGGSGQAEGFTATIETPGYYCLAVWKSLGKDLYAYGKYRLTILRGITAVPGEGGLPAVTALGSIRPNPCNPRAEVRFDLAREERVELAVYDLKGRRLRDLAGGVWPPGRHAVAWDGRDGSGREVGSGVYLLRLRAGEATEARKVTLVR